MSNFFDCSNPFMYIAFIWAIFFGWRSVYIFVDEKIYKGKKWDWWLYQVFFNSVGAFLGWVFLWAIWNKSFANYGLVDFLLAAAAYLGITGNLPLAALRGSLIK